MPSRRSMLATIGATVSVGAAGCLGDDGYNPDGMELLTDRENITGREVRWDFDLDEEEYAYDYVELPGSENVRFNVIANAASVYGLLMREREFDENYPDDDINGYFVKSEVGGVRDAGTNANTRGTSNWVVVADNTSHHDHEPKGPTSGRIAILLQRITRG